MKNPDAQRRRMRPVTVVAALAATIAIVCLIGAAVIARTTPASNASPGSVTSTPMTISQFLAATRAGNAGPTDLFAVQGWLQPTASPRISCPTLTPEGEFGIGCGGQALTISEKPDGTASVSVFALQGAAVLDAVTSATGAPARIVVIGHVHDPRASFCPEATRADCLGAFVLDQVASFDGRSFGPSVGVVSGDQPGKPALTADQVSAAVGKMLSPQSEIVSLTAMSLFDAWTYWRGLMPDGAADSIVWYVRVIGAPPLSPPLPGSHAGSGVIVYAEEKDYAGKKDPAGVIRGLAGWGWDPARAGIEMADGSRSLHTTNWLPRGLCGGVGLDAVLRGSPEDPRVVWLEFRFADWYSPDPSYREPTIVWPAGYRARFTPKAEIVDGGGNVVLRDGDRITGACNNDPDTNTMYLEPPFS